MNVPQKLPLESALDASSCAVVIADALKPDFPIVYLNQTFEKITGYKAGECIGRNCRFLHGNEHDQAGLRIVRKALKEHKPCTVVLRNFRKDGTMFWNELRLAPVFNSARGLTHYVGVQTDVTEKHEADMRLRELRNELERLVRDRTAQVEQKNAALKELVGQVELEKAAIQKNVLGNADSIIEPLLRKLARIAKTDSEIKIIGLIEKNLRDLTGPFGEKISRKLYRLSPREVQICNMIKNGLGSKDISGILKTSLSTIENQRNRIRKKLGISTQGVNLATFLQGM